MAPKEKRSFLPYSRGVDPEALRLGSLYLIPLDPEDGLESKRFYYQEDLDQAEYEERIKPRMWKEQKDERGFRLDFQVSKENSMGLKLSDIVKGEANAESTVSAVLEGKSGRRLKIKKPEKFLRDEVITQTRVQEWIRTQASIAFKGHFGMHKFKAPEIWMVTGVQLVTGGDVQVGSSRSVGASISAHVDPGLAFGAPPGLASVGVHASHNHGSEANHGYGYEDERVWAAQFMEVKIEYGDEEDKTVKAKENKLLPATISTFRLEDIADLKSRGIRATQRQRVDVPKLIGRIVVEDVDDDDADAESDNLHLSDHPYVEVLKDTDWDMYDECSKYLRDAETGGTSVSQEPILAG